MSWIGDDFNKVWEGLSQIGTSFDQKAAATIDFVSAIGNWDTDAMKAALGKYGEGITGSATGAAQALTSIPVLHETLEAFDAVRSHLIVRPVTTALLAGARADVAETDGGQEAGWDYFSDLSNWRAAWNDTQFVTFGQAATWYGSYAFMDEREADKLDPGTFQGREWYTGRHEAAIRASMHEVNMFDESGAADRYKFEQYVREVSRNPAAMDKYDANTWVKYSSGSLDFAAAFLDLPIIGWASKMNKAARASKFLQPLGTGVGTAETARGFIGRSDETLATLDRATALQKGTAADRVRDAIVSSEAVRPGLLDPAEAAAITDELDAARAAVLADEAAQLATLNPRFAKQYIAARDGNASHFQRTAVSNHAYGGQAAAALTAVAKHRQPHMFADLYASFYGDEMALARVQANAASYAVAIGRNQNTYNIATAARKWGVQEFATEIVRKQMDSMFNAHLDDVAQGEGAWRTGMGFRSQQNQPLIKVRSASKFATSIHQWSLYQPPITYTTRRGLPEIIRGKAGRIVGAFDRSRGYARDLDMNSQESYRDFRANLERADMDAAEVDKWTSVYMSQATAAQRSQIVAHVEDMLYRRLGSKLGLDESELDEVIQTVMSRRNAVQAEIKQNRVYAPTQIRQMADELARQGRDADAVRLREYAEAYESGAKKGDLPAFWRKSIDHRGNLVIVGEDINRNVFDSDSVFLSSQNADYLPMTDWRLIDNISRSYIAPRKRITEALRAREEGRITGKYDKQAEKVGKFDRVQEVAFKVSRDRDRLLDVINRTWSTLAVMTPKHTFRAMANDFAMSAIVHGELRTFTGAWRGAYQGGRNLYDRFQGAVERRRADKLRRQAKGDTFTMPVDETVEEITEQAAAAGARGRGRPKAIDRFEGIDLPPDIAAETAGRYSYLEDRGVPPTAPLAFESGDRITYQSLEEALSAGDLSTSQFLGAILADYRMGTLPVDYMQILDSVGLDKKGRVEALDMVMDFALAKLGKDAYRNPKFALDIFDGLYLKAAERPVGKASERAEIVADPLTGVWGNPSNVFDEYDTVDHIDVAPDADALRLMTEEYRLKQVAEGAVKALPKADTKPLDRARAKFETMHARLQAQTVKAQEAEARISERLIAREAARGPARRKATSAYAAAKKSAASAKARLAAMEAAYDTQKALVDRLEVEGQQASRAAQEARAAELFHRNRAALVGAHSEVDNMAYAYDFEAPEKLFRKHRGTFLQGNARMGFTLLPTGEIRVSVFTKAGERVAPAALTEAELPKVKEYRNNLLSTGNTGYKIRRGDQEITIPGAFYGDAGAAYRTAVAARAPQETWAADHMTKAADLAIAKVYGRGGWKPNITKDDAEYPTAYERTVNLELANDAVARLFMEGRNAADIERWVLSPKGRPWLNAHTMGGAHYWEQVAAIGTFVNQLLPTENLRALALSKKVTFADIRREIPEGQLPDVHGEALANATGVGLVFQKSKQAIDGFFKWMVNKPSDHLIRFPFFARAYNDELIPLKNEYLKAVGRDRMVDQDEINRLGEIAATRALRLTRNTLYETGFRTDAAEMLSKFMPFANANADAIFKWARVAYDRPVRTMSVASRWWLAPERMGLITDQNGYQLIREDGEDHWIDPMTLEEVPEDGEVGKERYVTMRLPSGLSPEMYNGKPAPLRIPKKSAELFLTWPTAGPWVSLPMNEFVLRVDPELGDNEIVKSLFLTYGPQSDVTRVVLPGLIRSGYEAFAEDDIDYANETMGYFAQQQVDYNFGLRREHPSVEDAREMASTMKTIRFMSSAFAPVSTSLSNPYETYVQYYKRLLAKHGGDKQLATDEFVEHAGRDAVALTYSVTRNTNGVPATKEAFAASKEFKDLLEKFPTWTGMILGQEGSSTWSKSIYEAQKRAGLRVPLTTEESATETSSREAWSRYDKFNKLVMTELNRRGLTSLSQRGSEDLAEYKRRWVEANKYWWGVNGEKELSPWYMDYSSRSAILEQRLIDAVQLVQDERLQGRDEVRGLIEYIQLRQEYKGYLTGAGFASLKPMGAANIRNSWEARVHDLKDRFYSFETLYTRYLENDDLTVNLDFDEILGRS